MTIDISTNEIGSSTLAEKKNIELTIVTDLSDNIVSPSAIVSEYESFKDDIPLENNSDDDLASIDTVNSLYMDQMKRSLDEECFTNRNLSAYNFKKSSHENLISIMKKKIKSSFSKEKDNYKEVQINDNDIIFEHDPDRPSPRKSMAGNEDKANEININISDNRSAEEEETDLDSSDFTRAELISRLVIKLQDTNKYDFETARKDLLSNNLVSMSSTHLDIISSYLNSQKMIYTESSFYTSTWLNYLMIPTIIISASASVISGQGDRIPEAQLIISCITAFSAFLLSVINYLKLDAASEAHKISAHQYDKLQSHIMFFSGKVLLFSEARFHFETKGQIEDKKLLESKLNVLQKNEDDIDTIKKKIDKIRVEFQQQEIEIQKDIDNNREKLQHIMFKIQHEKDEKELDKLKKEYNEKENKIESKNHERLNKKKEYSEKKTLQKKEIDAYKENRGKAIERESEFAKISLNSQENEIISKLLSDIKGEIENVQEKIKEIKETNQFEVPKTIRNRYPVIYNSNVFSWIKMIEDYKLILAIKLWIYKNKIICCETCITECYNILQIPGYIEGASLKMVRNEIKKFNKLKKKCEDIVSFIFESSITLSLSYSEIDNIFEDEIKSGELKKKYKYLFCLCPWAVNLCHNSQWFEDTFISFIYNTAVKKKDKLEALEGTNEVDKKRFWFRDNSRNHDLDNILV